MQSDSDLLAELHANIQRLKAGIEDLAQSQAKSRRALEEIRDDLGLPPQRPALRLVEGEEKP